ncbi:peptidylprolyl isomerase [Oleispira antarctica]|uniref:Peptidyl-prolyl cis-trans isomerase n=1 Tax=Oleispira antarctica TaxID=188908 RepID=A0A1Y5HNN2_OLEAN|nr:peptidylprolyl isomerase [Oleispira antarctica]
MAIAKDTVVQFHYTLKDADGTVIEASHGNGPMAYLHGHGNIIPGLEEEMLGKEAGAEFIVTVAPEKAYGQRDESAKQRVPMKHLQGAKKWKKGMVAHVETEQGQRQVTVIKVGKFMVDVDANHPFAGKELTFEVKVEDVRDATAEEIQHGHAHGLGGHQH